jgi:hypothetical protein
MAFFFRCAFVMLAPAFCPRSIINKSEVNQWNLLNLFDTPAVRILHIFC